MKEYALVTGAADRIGKALAFRLAEMGYHIILHYNRSVDKAKTVKEELINKYNIDVQLVSINFLEADNYYTVFEDFKNKGFNISILVNSASDFKESNIQDDGIDTFRHFMTINFESAYLLTKAFTKYYDQGLIINLLDTKVTKNHTRHFDYLLSKKLLASFTQLAAMELGPNFRVNGIGPGLILPPPGKDYDYLDGLRKDNPLHAIGDLEQIQNTLSYFVENKFITGQIIYVDGGENL